MSYPQRVPVMSSTALPLESRSLLILHASVTGTAIDVAERIGRFGRRQGWSVAVKGVAEFDRSELLSTPLIVFVLATAGNGVAPACFTPLWTSLLHPSLPSDILEDLRYAVFGLGDSSYPKYNWVGRKLSRRLATLGAHAVMERGEGDDQNEFGIESTLPTWLKSLYTSIDPLFPAPADFVPLSADILPPARVRLSQVRHINGNGNSNGNTKHQGTESSGAWAADGRWAKVSKLVRATRDGWYQDVRTLELEIEGGVTFAAGDVLEIRPENSDDDVAKFLGSIGWNEFADIPYDITPASEDQPLPPHLSNPHRTTLRRLLKFELDICSVPRVSFFEWLAGFSQGDMKEKLTWFCDGEGQDDLTDYTLRPRRTITEVLFEFKEAKVPPEYVFDLLPPLRARGFSIASSPLAYPNQVHLLVAVVNYKTILSTPRKGVATSYISRLSIGDRIPVRFESGILTLPAQSTTPLIMVGPGTGVAPFRSLMQERRLADAKDNLLFFGCRKESVDYYYRDEWQALVESGHLTLSVAASRDQEDKIYVQHRILEYASLIWSYLNRGGVIYICGSSTSMPKAVKKSFLAIFASEGKLVTAEEGEGYWEQLEREGRVVEETWG